MEILYENCYIFGEILCGVCIVRMLCLNINIIHNTYLQNKSIRLFILFKCFKESSISFVISKFTGTLSIKYFPLNQRLTFNDDAK